jgi:two-component system LytT family sensor kinase
MNKKYKILFHLPVWIIALGLILAKGILSPNAFANPLFESIQLLIVAIWILGDFYIFYLYVVPELLQKHRITSFFLLSGVILCILPIFSHFAIWSNKLIFGQFHNYSFTFRGWLASFFVTTFIGGLGVFYRFATDWFLNQGLKDKMENLQLKSEINLLKSKLNPHFLFNTLNNIDTLIETNSKNASDYLGKLSSILRYIVYDTENEKVDIEKEIACIRDYIELQKLRVEENSSIVLKSKGNYEGYKIAPVLLLPFVENIFKHGDFTSHKNKTYIDIDLRNGVVYFDSMNSTDRESFDKLKCKGVGIETTRKRLELLYHGLYKLEIREENDMFFVKLEIDLNDN